MPSLRVSAGKRDACMSETTLQLVERIETNDDLNRSAIASFIGSIIHRSLPNIFHKHLNTWPTIKIQPDWACTDKNIYHVIVEYQHWKDGGDIDGTIYQTDKEAFCVLLDSFAEQVSQRLLSEEKSGKPWWTGPNENKEHLFLSLARTNERLYPWIEHLGVIKKRGGRFVWFMKPCNKFSTIPQWTVKEHRQGVAATFDEAKSIIEKGWTNEKAS